MNAEEFQRLSDLLPEGVNWGDPIQPWIVEALSSPIDEEPKPHLDHLAEPTETPTDTSLNAGRYMWLRDQSYYDVAPAETATLLHGRGIKVMWEGPGDRFKPTLMLHGEMLDNLVDAKIAAQSGREAPTTEGQAK